MLYIDTESMDADSITSISEKLFQTHQSDLLLPSFQAFWTLRKHYLAVLFVPEQTMPLLCRLDLPQ